MEAFHTNERHLEAQRADTDKRHSPGLADTVSAEVCVAGGFRRSLAAKDSTIGVKNDFIQSQFGHVEYLCDRKV